MAPHVVDMTAEEPCSPAVLSPVGEGKLGSEENSRKQEVTGTEPEMSKGKQLAVNDSVCLEELFCRICHEDQSCGELLSPCECSGSLATVHRTCLEQWLTTSNMGHCELCRHQFALERLPKPLTEWLCAPAMQQQRRTLCGDAVCFLFITPLASLSGWLCVQGAMDLYYTKGMEAVGLLVLTLALFTIYVFWTVVSARYHMHLFMTWKKTGQRVRLHVPSPGHGSHKHQSVSISSLSKAPDKDTVV
ncbi:E3 ubiquitin-protein ligase MARCH3-like isoform X2 [Cynoglossus semilaevis]|uniref:E3 ubiquitin-protein ligase MARCH3-like n=1 Tax=Cynoglossus semilaevis TaxID=244447 RepID=A0A3P8VAW5_CYNSE|nr:E3 ubiquitin-protein ligase MARCH3-like isoform X2 [Cynoglossus semilaevis]